MCSRAKVTNIFSDSPREAEASQSLSSSSACSTMPGNLQRRFQDNQDYTKKASFIKQNKNKTKKKCG